MNTLERQRLALIAQLSALHEQGAEHDAEIRYERRLGIMDRPDRDDKRFQLELSAQIGSLERRLQRVEMGLGNHVRGDLMASIGRGHRDQPVPCELGCSCMGGAR